MSKPVENYSLLDKCLHIPTNRPCVVTGVWKINGLRMATVRFDDKSKSRVAMRDLRRMCSRPVYKLAAACGLTVAQVREALA